MQHAHSQQEEFFILPHRNRHKQRDAEDGIMTRDRIVLPLGLPSPPTGTTSVVWTPDIFTSQTLFLFFCWRSMGNFQTLKAKKEVLQWGRSKLETLSKLMILFLYTWWIILCCWIDPACLCTLVITWAEQSVATRCGPQWVWGAKNKTTRNENTRHKVLKERTFMMAKKKKKTKKRWKRVVLALGSYTCRDTHTRGTCDKDYTHSSVWAVLKRTFA